MKIEAASLALTGIRHAFFTREGGVSEGLYASLNGGIGSRDAADKVAENRARMAAALGVEPHRFLTAYQIHSPNVVVAEAAVDRRNPSPCRCHRDAHARARHWRDHRRLRTRSCWPIRRRA